MPSMPPTRTRVGERLSMNSPVGQRDELLGKPVPVDVGIEYTMIRFARSATPTAKIIAGHVTL